MRSCFISSCYTYMMAYTLYMLSVIYQHQSSSGGKMILNDAKIIVSQGVDDPIFSLWCKISLLRTIYLQCKHCTITIIIRWNVFVQYIIWEVYRCSMCKPRAWFYNLPNGLLIHVRVLDLFFASFFVLLFVQSSEHIGFTTRWLCANCMTHLKIDQSDLL